MINRLLITFPLLQVMTVVGYEIEQLEQIIEEEAPLAPGPAGNYFGLTMIGLLILVVGALVASYMFTCMKYKKKIKLLDDSGKSYYGYRLEKLQETLSELEYNKLNEMDEMD